MQFQVKGPDDIEQRLRDLEDLATASQSLYCARDEESYRAMDAKDRIRKRSKARNTTSSQWNDRKV